MRWRRRRWLPPSARGARAPSCSRRSRAEAEAAAHKERVERAADKEAALLKRIDELENGPGCASELRERALAAQQG